MIADTWTQQAAIEFCTLIESVCPKFGFHVALTGGCLYKLGPRMDLDLVFYRDRRQPRDRDGLLAALGKLFPLELGQANDWRVVVFTKGKKVDMIFPQWMDPYDKR